MTTTSSSSGRPPQPGAVPEPRGAHPSFDRGDPPGPHSSRPHDELASAPPLLRVVRGEPTAEELAALTVVVAALAQRRRPRRRPAPVGAWSWPADGHRRPLQPGPGGWRASGRTA
ncbi:acyl-CoA carboxylase subunit epsilon [Geodermatophilus sp. DSM 44513]|uniref:acyl-CoA carboxylase subunit epsilon n=1 Tax=Geodermatophilus sp. DSM 44513 TaxID=1528104 RepID=UPI0028F74EFB|nr:acyl-CoA carboxylase subunit epsilon [Geodermatophilus sp. DSM 44513]WNV74822.1 acyl-CoA carboxylase subunit epsilon [Geodermatophilus sp. DSM 44513]